MISYRSLWEDLVEILLNSSVKRSLHLLALGSWRCSAWVLVWQFFWGLRRKFLYEDLVRYSIKKVLFWRPYEILLDVLVWGCGMKSWWVDIALLHAPKQIPAADAAVPIMSNLTCYCFIATVAGISYFDLLPTTLFGASCRRCNLCIYNNNNN